MKEKEYKELIELIDVMGNLANAYAFEKTPYNESIETISLVREELPKDFRERDITAFKHGFASAYTLLTKGENE